jgi:hypothetical protein
MNTHYKLTGKALAICNAFGFLFPGELFLLQSLVQSLPEGAVVVNIGAGVGTGSLGMVEMRPDLKAFTVDISEGGPNGGLENERNAFHGTGLPLPRQILGDSQVVWKDWFLFNKEQTEIDLIFIDGDHSSVGLQRDMDGWLRYVKPGGYAVFHDYKSVSWADVTSTIEKNMRSDGWTEVLAVDTAIAFRKDAASVSKRGRK